MRTLFCNHTPTEDSIKEMAHDLGVFWNVDVLACDMNDVKAIMTDASNYVCVEGVGVGARRLPNALEDAVARCSEVAWAYHLFSAHHVLLRVEYNDEKPLLMEEQTRLHAFLSKFGDEAHLIVSLMADNEGVREDRLCVRILAADLALK